MSLEEAGRAARYDAFEKTAALHGYNKTAVAHHRDDQAETMLMNLFRGSGIHGMAGMRPQRGGIIRPLLCVSRAEIELYLNRRGIAYCTDASNYENMYTRNRLRNELLPYVKEHINRGAVEHIVRFGEQAEEIDCYFQKITKILFDKYGRMEQNAVILNVTCRQEEKLAVTFLIRYALERLGAGLRDIGTEHVDKIYQLLSGRTGAKLPLPGNISVEKSYEQLIFRHGDSRNTPAGLPAEVGYLEPEQSVRVEFGTLEFTFQVRKRKKNETFPKKKYTKWFDYDKIESMLQLRTRRTGDSIAVCADGGRKTLKKYFIDAKIPRDERESTVLLADGSEIVWIVGQRISERYKVHADTEWILEAVCAGMEDTAHT